MKERYKGEEPEPIVQWFIPTQTPEGGAPEEVREQWIGVALPVRESNAPVAEEKHVRGYLIGANVVRPGDIHVNNPEDMVAIELEDAIKALRLAGREGASGWWEDWREIKPDFFGTTLMFMTRDGDLVSPAEVEDISPGATNFDQHL
jgi:hypothetical protein